MDGATLQRLAILENRMALGERRADDIEVRLLTVEQSTRFAAMAAAKYDPVIGIPTFGPVLYEVWTTGCNTQRIPNVRVTGSLYWSDQNTSTFVSVGDAFDITSDSDGKAYFYGRQVVNSGDFGGVITATRNVGRPDLSLRGSYYRAQAVRPTGTSAFWQSPPDSFNLTTGASGDPAITGTVVFQTPQKLVVGAPPNYTCGPVNRGPYPLNNPFTIDGVLGVGTKTFGPSANTMTVTKIRGGATYSWNGFAWAGNLTGNYDVIWSFAGGTSSVEPTLQGTVLRVNPGGGERPVDRTSNNTGASPAPTNLVSAATAPSSASGTGTAAGWVLSYTYDFTGTAFNTLTGITTVTVTSA